MKFFSSGAEVAENHFTYETVSGLSSSVVHVWWSCEPRYMAYIELTLFSKVVKSGATISELSDGGLQNMW